MQIKSQPLKPLSSVEISATERTLLKWMNSAQWEPVKDAHEPIPYRTKVPEFYGGVRLYNMQRGTGSLSALELFIKKLQMQGVIGKQEMYPLAGHGNVRHLSLKKADMDNLGVGKEAEEDEE